MVRMKKLVAGIAGLLLITSPLGSTSASAADAGACTVTGAVTSSGIGLTPTNNTFNFTSVTISCTAAGAGNGNWTVNTVNGTESTTSENCAAAVSLEADLSGSSPNDGLITAGSVTGRRAGANVYVDGTISTANHDYTFHGHLIFQPTNGVCSGGSGNTTAANIIIGSTAAVTEA